jgi:hypothetical protein
VVITDVRSLYKKRLKIPKGGNQNPYIEEEQTTQWSKEILPELTTSYVVVFLFDDLRREAKIVELLTITV